MYAKLARGRSDRWLPFGDILLAYAAIMECLILTWSMAVTGLVRSTICLVYTTVLSSTGQLDLTLYLLVDIVGGLVRFLAMRHPLDRPALGFGLSLVQLAARLMLEMARPPAELLEYWRSPDLVWN